MTARVCFVDFCSRFWRRRYMLSARPSTICGIHWLQWIIPKHACDVTSAAWCACHTRCAFSGVMWVKSTTCTRGSALHLWGFSGRQWPRSVRAPRATPKRGCSAGGLQLWLWGCR
jgi:hypothetical protein